MPWKETCAMEQRVAFVIEVHLGEYSVAALCRRYGISRRIGYKWLERYRGGGTAALADQSRAPKRHPNQVEEVVEQAVVSARQAHPTWGPKKLRVVLLRGDPEQDWPVQSTLGEILKRHGLTAPWRRRQRVAAREEPFGQVDGPNATWCADFKGWFRTGDGRRCDPLTVSDAYSRYLVRCQGMKGTDGRAVRGVFEAALREYGLPEAIRTDNGPPFAGLGLAGLSRLSVWWVKLGVRPERIDPGQPQQNGRHERMHLTLKVETADPPAGNGRAQQRRFDGFREEFNYERPHEGLGMRTPGSVYVPSSRAYPERVSDPGYGDWPVRRVQGRGEFMWGQGKVFLSKVLEGELVGLEALDGRYWGVWFGRMSLGMFDSGAGRMLTGRERRRLGLWAVPFRPGSFRCAPGTGTEGKQESVTHVPG